MTDQPIPSISGAERIIEWFGRWPSFHDAEILEIRLHRLGKSFLRLHTWLITGKAYDRQAVVTFWLENVLDLELDDFSCQNVIFGLKCEGTEKGIRLTMSPCYGLAGYVEAEKVSVSLEPGEPTEDQ